VKRLDESLNWQRLAVRLWPQRFPQPEIDYSRLRLSRGGHIQERE
jgi:hypothetical protein